LSDGERIDWLRLSRTPGIGSITFFALIARFGGAAAAIAELPRLAARGGKVKAAEAPSIADIMRDVERTQRLGARYVAACEPDYPAALSAIDDAPPVIAAGRDLSLFERPSVAIVGARNASLNGRRIAAKLAQDLSEAGFVIVSGLARGIDTEAHKGSLEHGTIAVIAGGLDIVYPPENGALQAAILERGCVVRLRRASSSSRRRRIPGR
jgi:DNA processing protein